MDGTGGVDSVSAETSKAGELLGWRAGEEHSRLWTDRKLWRLW